MSSIRTFYRETSVQQPAFHRQLDTQLLDTAFSGWWVREISDFISQSGFPYSPVYVEIDFPAFGLSLLTALRHLGAEIRPYESVNCWKLNASNHLSFETLTEFQAEETKEPIALDFRGIVEFSLDSERWIAGKADNRGLGGTENVTVLGGPSLKGLLNLVGRMNAALQELRDQRLRLFGSKSTWVSLAEVADTDLVLPAELKTALLSYVERFRVASTNESFKAMGLSRGILLLGRPGTGKTMAIKHILGRFLEARRYVYVPAPLAEMAEVARGFQEMAQSLSNSDRQSVVIVEDIDRLFQSGTVTQSYFLNMLDGLLRPNAPVLWIATCNDPSDLPQSILDRPGRFDRIFVFPDPGLNERLELFRKNIQAPLAAEMLAAFGETTEGLTGAHIVEACRSAALTLEMDGGDYAAHLAQEIDLMLNQHETANRYIRSLRGETVGF